MKGCTHDLVRVGWVDADEKSGWHTYNKDEPTWKIYTVGYLVEKPKTKTDFIVLANSHLPETNEWGGLNRIPKGMILSIETISKAIPCGETHGNASNNPRRPRALPTRQQEV